MQGLASSTQPLPAQLPQTLSTSGCRKELEGSLTGHPSPNSPAWPALPWECTRWSLPGKPVWLTAETHRSLIPSRTLPIVANTERAFFPGRDIHHSLPSPLSTRVTSIVSGKRERQQVFLKSLYPPEDREEDIPSEHLVTHIRGDKSLNLHLHGTGIRCGPVTPSSA